jgi:hypothetical protein
VPTAHASLAPLELVPARLTVPVSDGTVACDQAVPFQ